MMSFLTCSPAANKIFNDSKHCKKIYRIPVFFYQTFQKQENPYMLTRNFLVPSREGIFCLLRREKSSSYFRGNFFPAVGCYISLFPLFPYYIYMKINGRFPAGHRSAGQSGHKIRPLRKKIGLFC
jgi:hypothetical protein